MAHMNKVRFCLVSDDGIDDELMLDRLDKALSSGLVDLFQLRHKKYCDKNMLQLALRAKEICRSHDVPIVLDDRVDVALAADLDGVHVGQDDLPAVYARRLLGPDKLLGVTAHSRQQALEAENAGADYLGVGAIFSTSTKDDVGLMGIDMVKTICGAVNIPVLAIGGLNAENIHILAGTSAAGVCVVSAVMRADDPVNACASIRAACEQMLKSN